MDCVVLDTGRKGNQRSVHKVTPLLLAYWKSFCGGGGGGSVERRVRRKWLPVDACAVRRRSTHENEENCRVRACVRAVRWRENVIVKAALASDRLFPPCVQPVVGPGTGTGTGGDNASVRARPAGPNLGPPRVRAGADRRRMST